MIGLLLCNCLAFTLKFHEIGKDVEKKSHALNSSKCLKESQDLTLHSAFNINSFLFT